MAASVGITGEVPYTELLGSDWRRLVWGFLWRGLCFTLVSGLGGFVVGFLVGVVGGLIAAMAGVPPAEYTLPLKIASGLLGFVLGLWLFTFYLRWLLRARFGSLRLALVRTSA